MNDHTHKAECRDSGQARRELSAQGVSSGGSGSSGGAVDVLAKVCGGELQARLLAALARGERASCWPAGAFVSLARRGLIDARDYITPAGSAALARCGGAK